jgi:hypothetical protein
MTVHRAEICDGSEQPYRLGEHVAGTLCGLAQMLIKSGFDPNDTVECFRPGRSEWDIRIASLRRAAAMRPYEEAAVRTTRWRRVARS